MKSGFWSTGSELFLADRQGEDCLNDTFLMLDDESCFEKDGYQTCPLKSVKISEIRVFPIHCHAALSKTKSQKRVVILRETKRSRRIYWRTIELSFCVKWNGVAESIEEPSNCHSARSNAESQNLIVILRETKWYRRIYWRTDDGFCNSGQWSPPCRMTGWRFQERFFNHC